MNTFLPLLIDLEGIAETSVNAGTAKYQPMSSSQVVVILVGCAVGLVAMAMYFLKTRLKKSSEGSEELLMADAVTDTAAAMDGRSQLPVASVNH